MYAQLGKHTLNRVGQVAQDPEPMLRILKNCRSFLYGLVRCSSIRPNDSLLWCSAIRLK